MKFAAVNLENLQKNSEVAEKIQWICHILLHKTPCWKILKIERKSLVTLFIFQKLKPRLTKNWTLLYEKWTFPPHIVATRTFAVGEALHFSFCLVRHKLQWTVKGARFQPIKSDVRCSTRMRSRNVSFCVDTV